MYADSQHFVKSLHRGLWAFSGRRRSRSHSCQSLPSCFRPPARGNPERERERDNLSLNASELEKQNLGWLLRWKRLSPGGNPSTSGKPQAAPSAEAQIAPKKLDKAAVEIWAFPGRRRSRLHSCQSLPSFLSNKAPLLCNQFLFYYICASAISFYFIISVARHSCKSVSLFNIFLAELRRFI